VWHIHFADVVIKLSDWWRFLIFVVTEAGGRGDACAFLATIGTTRIVLALGSALVVTFHDVGLLVESHFGLLGLQGLEGIKFLGRWPTLLVDLLLLDEDVSEEECTLIELLDLAFLLTSELSSEAAQCGFVEEDDCNVRVAVYLLDV